MFPQVGPAPRRAAESAGAHTRAQLDSQPVPSHPGRPVIYVQAAARRRRVLGGDNHAHPPPPPAPPRQQLAEFRRQRGEVTDNA